MMPASEASWPRSRTCLRLLNKGNVMNLSDIRPPKGQKHKKQRVGQGMGSRRGKYSGRGAKGAKGRQTSAYLLLKPVPPFRQAPDLPSA